MSHYFRRRSDAISVLPVVRWAFENGRIVAYPTETVYGLASSLDDAGLDRIASLKGRPGQKPCLLLINSPAMLDQWGFEVSELAERLIRAFWPGPLTLILPNRDLRIPQRLRSSHAGVAVRWTPHPGLGVLIDGLRQPLISTSANPEGLPPARSAQEVEQYFQEAIGQGRLEVLDGGHLVTALPSTLVDCTGEGNILREGEITRGQLRRYLSAVS